MDELTIRGGSAHPSEVIATARAVPGRGVEIDWRGDDHVIPEDESLRLYGWLGEALGRPEVSR